ncbi:MAG TPA: IclR family transcriptional regulator [Steroidobacteraceae bacterium]|jgi:DNA-binding IclR family transcriptional regulator|nr:IclR family transcriptional regulator [Steroidobacteraceae bacterium]
MNKPAKVPAAANDAGVAKSDRHFVTALARGLEVLACYRHGDRMLGNQELARRCGLAKSTVSRLTHTLTKLGYLIYVEDSAKYSLGTATLSLGSAMLARLDIRKLAHPLMQQLAEFGQCMVSLGSRDRLSMLYIDAVRGSAAVTLSLDSGARIQIATSAMGRAYLTAIPENERDDIMGRVRELADVNRWPELQQGVAKALCDIRELGVCCSFGEWQKDVNAIAVPVRPGGGLPPMAINCGAPAYMVSKEFLLEKVRPRLIALADELETSLGTGGREPAGCGRSC